MDQPTPARTLDAIARPGGGFAMVAIDARESMRAILRDAGHPHGDHDLSAFKATVARRLGDLPSAMLCDLRFGEAAIRELRRTHPETGIIIAVDHFDEDRLGPLRETRLDEHAVAHAAEAFGAASPDIYKTQLPTFGRTADTEVERQARRVSDAVGAPWVVLSNGVAQERFAEAVAAAGRGGASGLLAGRAVWRPALAAPDPEQELASGGRARVRELLEVVDAHARPWRGAASR